MSRTIEKTLFTFAELGDSAKERAREWYRNGADSEDLGDVDDWQAIAAILGIEFETRAVRLMGGGTRREPCIYWCGFSLQGDGASFEGSYSYAKGAPKRIREYAPQDSELHRIADALQEAQRPAFYRLEARATRGSGSNFYSHSGTMAVEVWDSQNEWRSLPDEGDTVRDAMRSFADWIYRQLESEWEYRNSDEAIDESIIVNEYEFDENGALA